MKNITFVTGNEFKFNQAVLALKNLDIILDRQTIDTPEIQSTNVTEIAAYSACWASEKLGKPVIVTDVSYEFQALNGFPGPFIKYINQWLTAQDLLNLMAGKTNRTVDIFQCLSYCEPDKKPVSFLGKVSGTISHHIGTSGNWKTPINQVFIPDGYDKVVGDLPHEEMVAHWNEDTVWSQFVDYISKV